MFSVLSAVYFLHKIMWILSCFKEVIYSLSLMILTSVCLNSLLLHLYTHYVLLTAYTVSPHVNCCLPQTQLYSFPCHTTKVLDTLYFYKSSVQTSRDEAHWISEKCMNREEVWRLRQVCTCWHVTHSVNSLFISCTEESYLWSNKGMVRSDMSKPALIFFSLQEYTQQNTLSKF
jgi:hypothetical protein